MNKLWQSPISPGLSWYETSINQRPEYPTLDGDCDCDVVVIGGGFTGLSAAFHLANAGTNVVLVEAHRLGDGASGRNGGQFGSGHHCDILELEKQYGFERSRALWEMAEKAKASLHDLASNAGFDFEYKCGQLSPMHKRRFEAKKRAEIEVINERYDYHDLIWLDQEEMSGKLGSHDYFGGSQDKGTGHFHPLKYLVGLAKAAANSGANIFENTSALNIKKSSRIKIQTNRCVITADKCLLAVNGYHGGLEKQTARHIMPIQSFIIATEPLPQDSGIIPDGEAVDDSRNLVRYFRKSSDNRLLFGGRNPFGSRNPSDAGKGIHRQMCAVYPSLKNIKITHQWGGSVATTIPRMPFVREVKPGIWSIGGYSGHGVVLSNYAGRLIAEKFLGISGELDHLSDLEIPPFPGGQMMRSPLLYLAMMWYSLRDRV